MAKQKQLDDEDDGDVDVIANLMTVTTNQVTWCYVCDM